MSKDSNASVPPPDSGWNQATHRTHPLSLSSRPLTASGNPTHQHPAVPTSTYFPCLTNGLVGSLLSPVDRTSLAVEGRGKEGCRVGPRFEGTDGPLEDDSAEAISISIEIIRLIRLVYSFPF